MRRNIKLKLAFDGTGYHGWQHQNNAVSVQETVTKGIYRVTKEKISLTGCGRTDTGVHATGFVANFYSTTPIRDDRLPYALNNALPGDIRVLDAQTVENEFHSRFDAKSKTYEYKIYNTGTMCPFLRNYGWHVPFQLDIDAMKQAVKHLVGIHDFSAFTAAGCIIKNRVREIYSLELTQVADQLTLVINANGYLYNMVRIIAGTLVHVGRGKKNVSDIPDILLSKDRTRAGETAPPQGLTLVGVDYHQHGETINRG